MKLGIPVYKPQPRKEVVNLNKLWWLPFVVVLSWTVLAGHVDHDGGPTGDSPATTAR